jgi:hypothetical protein
MELPEACAQPLWFDPVTGILLEGRLELPGSLFIGNGEGPGTWIGVGASGVTEIGPCSQDGTTFHCEESVDRQVLFPASPRFRLLLRQTMLEFYLDDLLIQCYMMESPADGSITCQNASQMSLWQWT